VLRRYVAACLPVDHRQTKFEGDDLRRNDPKFQQPRFSQYLAAVASLDRFGGSATAAGLRAAVRWVLDQGGDTIALWGARRPAQLNPVEDAMGWELDDQGKRRIDEIVNQAVTDPVGPEFMAPPSRGGSI
jgi:aryl-alcohol dehydrogenase-like predicted oxidoreductase